MRLISLVVLMIGLSASQPFADDPSPPRCLMRPDHLEMRLPIRGFSWLPGEEFSGKCKNVAQEKYIPNSSGAFKLFVYADGPSGSARYWNVTVAVAEGEHAKQNRVTEKT